MPVLLCRPISSPDSMVNVAGSGIAPDPRFVIVGDDNSVRLKSIDDLRTVQRVDHLEHLGLLGGAFHSRRPHEVFGEQGQMPEPNRRSRG